MCDAGLTSAEQESTDAGVPSSDRTQLRSRVLIPKIQRKIVIKCLFSVYLLKVLLLGQILMIFTTLCNSETLFRALQDYTHRTIYQANKFRYQKKKTFVQSSALINNSCVV